MSRNNCFTTGAVGVIVFLALSSLGAAQNMDVFSHNSGGRQYTLASLDGNYAVTGIFGPHAGGYVGVTDINSQGVIGNNTGTVVDPALPAPLELSTTGTVTVNPDGTGAMTEYVTVAGGPAAVPYHFRFVIKEAYERGDQLIAVRIVLLQEESSPLPNEPNFASFEYTRRPDSFR